MPSVNLTEKKRNIMKHKNLLSYIKWVKKFHRWGILKLEKMNFTATGLLLFKKDVDIGKVLVYHKISFGEKKTINTLLVNCAMIIKLSHYI